MVLYDFWIVSYLAMTVSAYRHCEERSDEAIQKSYTTMLFLLAPSQ